jgi:hypothetical protein
VTKFPPKHSAPKGHAKQKLATESLAEIDTPKLYEPLGQGVHEARKPEDATYISNSGTARHAGKHLETAMDEEDGGTEIAS